MKSVSNAGKHVTCVKRGKTCDWCHERENMEPLSSAKKHESRVKRGKTWKPGQARENMQSVSSAGKHEPVLRAGKHATIVKRRNLQVDVDVAFDWLENLVCM